MWEREHVIPKENALVEKMLRVQDLDCELWEHEEYSQGMKEEIIEGICSV